MNKIIKNNKKLTRNINYFKSDKKFGKTPHQFDMGKTYGKITSQIFLERAKEKDGRCRTDHCRAYHSFRYRCQRKITQIKKIYHDLRSAGCRTGAAVFYNSRNFLRLHPLCQSNCSLHHRVSNLFSSFGFTENTNQIAGLLCQRISVIFSLIRMLISKHGF